MMFIERVFINNKEQDKSSAAKPGGKTTNVY
jgi:hypothetical protein